MIASPHDQRSSQCSASSGCSPSGPLFRKGTLMAPGTCPPSNSSFVLRMNRAWVALGLSPNHMHLHHQHQASWLG